MVEIKDSPEGGEEIGISYVHETFTELPQVMNLIENIKNNWTDCHKSEEAYEKYSKIMNEYQEQPHLLDPHLEPLLNTLVELVKKCDEVNTEMHEYLKYLYFITKVRGYKVVIRHLPHQISDLELVLSLLEKQDPKEIDKWHSRYMLLLWLSIIVMIPFHMSRIDSFHQGEGEKKSMVVRILDLCKEYIKANDSCKYAAIFLASRFFIRADAKQEYLTGFIDWCCTGLTEAGCGWRGLEPVASLLKHGRREDLLPFIPNLLRWVLEGGYRSSPDAMTRKSSIKVVQRIGLTFLKARVATWRYKRGNRSLATNLRIEGVGAELPTSIDEVEQDDDFEVPPEIEDVVEELVAALRDADTRVRYSAAKGLGRLSARLPKDMADEVLASVIELFSPAEPDGAWHGASLSLAELGRRGLLLPSRLPDVISAVTKALDYDDVRAHNFAVGGAVRDAACYVVWSLARAFDATVMKPYVQTIASALMAVAVFDREINCRRAASAAFQENVGRQGTFPHGIDIVTVADYFALGSRNNSYLKISYLIAGFEEYTRPLINHLVTRKINHWDASIRDLSSKALGILTKRDPQYVLIDILPQVLIRTMSRDLDERHGAVLALAELMLSLSQTLSTDDKYFLEEDIVLEVQNLVAKAKNSGHFRGLGGELMWGAMLKMMEYSSLAHLPLESLTIRDEWQDTLKESLVHKEASVREKAAPTLAAFLTEYHRNDPQVCKSLVQHFISGLKGNRTERLGSTLALGAMPAFALNGLVDEVISALASCSICSFPQETIHWADCRKSAIKALSSLTVTLKFCTDDDKSDSALDKEHAVIVYNSLLRGLDDYTLDSTGDIGAWVREASMEGLVVVTRVVCSEKPSILTEDLMGEVVARLLQQCVEPIGRLQDCAVKALAALLNIEPPISSIPHRSEVNNVIPKEDPLALTHYTEAETFPRIVKLLSIPRYTHRLLLGLISSTGSLTESLMRRSVDAVTTHLKTLPESSLEAVCLELIKVADQHCSSCRLSLPLLRSLGELIESGSMRRVLSKPVSPENPSVEFASEILRLIRKQLTSAPTVYKRMAAANALTQLIQAGTSPTVMKGCFGQLAILLGCNTPRARLTTASLLYETLLMIGDDEFPDTSEMAMSILAESDWISSDPSVVREARNKFCTQLGLPIPKSIPRSK